MRKHSFRIKERCNSSDNISQHITFPFHPAASAEVIGVNLHYTLYKKCIYYFGNNII